MTLEQRVEILERSVSGLKKSVPGKDETLALDELRETILDWASCLSCASPLQGHPQLL